MIRNNFCLNQNVNPVPSVGTLYFSYTHIRNLICIKFVKISMFHRCRWTIFNGHLYSYYVKYLWMLLYYCLTKNLIFYFYRIYVVSMNSQFPKACTYVHACPDSFLLTSKVIWPTNLSTLLHYANPYNQPK